MAACPRGRKLLLLLLLLLLCAPDALSVLWLNPGASPPGGEASQWAVEATWSTGPSAKAASGAGGEGKLADGPH